MTCGRCGREREKQSDGYCKACRNEYERDRRKVANLRAYRKGYEAFRARAMEALLAVGWQEMNGARAADIMRRIERFGS